jgi:hypothetical protein
VRTVLLSERNLVSPRLYFDQVLSFAHHPDSKAMIKIFNMRYVIKCIRWKGCSPIVVSWFGVNGTFGSSLQETNGNPAATMTISAAPGLMSTPQGECSTHKHLRE